MARILMACVFLLVFAHPAWATWSVIAIDQRTKTVVIASATCVSSAGLASRGGLKNIQAIVVPGIGIAAAQANVDGTHANQQLIFDELKKGTPPSDILKLLQSDPRSASRQFGIIDMQGRLAGWSGGGNQAVSLDVQGQVPGTAIYFSIQGNILKSEAVVHEAVAAFKAASGSLTDRVMAAMEAADKQGGDSRCSCENPRNPTVAAPCTSKTAHVAYILRSDASDQTGEAHSDGKYAMFLDVTDANITPNEDANPVKTLRMRYDAWVKAPKPPR